MEQRERRLRLARLGIAAVLFALVSGCVDIPGTGAPPQLFMLSPKSTFPSDLPKAEWQLVVELPVAPSGLATQSIALTHDPIRLEYYANARWAERAPQMVQTLIVESFENTRKIVAVGREAIGLRSDFNLKTDLREFQAEYTDGDVPVAHVRINAKLIRQPERQIIASSSFEARVTASDSSMDGVVHAFDDALGKVLRDLVVWALRTAAV
jgi:cholesterol transport system auxiliary component